VGGITALVSSKLVNRKRKASQNTRIVTETRDICPYYVEAHAEMRNTANKLTIAHFGIRSTDLPNQCRNALNK